MSDPIGDWLRRRLTHTEIIDGIVVTIVAVEWEPLAARVRSAVEIIRSYDPYRLNVIRKYLQGGIRVEFSAVSTGAEFKARTRSCVLHPDYVNSEVDPEDLAATLVHEATHARLRHIGFKYDNAQARVREEAVCLRQEMAFARRLPDGEGVAEMARRRIAALDPKNYDEAAFKRLNAAHRFRLIRRSRKLGMPGWVLRGGGLIVRLLMREKDKRPVPSPRVRGEGHARGVLSARREGRRQTQT